MANHSSATTRRETPHTTQTHHVNETDANETHASETAYPTRTTRTASIINALKRRAESVLNDPSLDAQSRAVLRYALETNDPWLAKLVRRVDAGEPVLDTIESSQPRASDLSEDANEAESSGKKIQALAEIICRGSDESAGALFVLMGMLQNSEQPQVIANTVKHLAFTRCGELNLCGIVDAQVAMLEGELLAGDTIHC